MLDTALTLFIELGYENTSIQMILDQSGVSKGTF
ncbi:TetR/AcrR family transcriptional regulator [Paenibacillus montaniterrae]|nr:helix-turn-helix domain-containing protein [Paenibacillus montaniterrae]